MPIWNIPVVPRQDTLSHYRDLLFYWFSVGTVLVVAPFVGYAFIIGNLALAFAGLGMVLMFAVDAIFLHYGKRPPVPPILAFIPVIITICTGIATAGVLAVFWTYPSLMVFQFVLSRGTANTVNVILSIAVVVMATLHLEPSITIRVAATLLLTLIFTNVFMHVVNELQNRLRDRAILDPLTGIHNRRHFEDNLDNEIARSNASGVPLALLLIDIDFFKAVNDTLGHATGDQVLASVAKRLKDSLRPSDMVFRIGGEEFAALLLSTNREAATIVAEKLRATIAEARILADRQVTISIGLDIRRANDDRASLLGRCDDALYKAKERGRNRVEHAVPATAGRAASAAV